MAERLSRREKGVSAFVPTNVAVNFVQHNRCNGHVFHSMFIAIVKLCSHVSVSWSYCCSSWWQWVDGCLLSGNCKLALISHQQKMWLSVSWIFHCLSLEYWFFKVLPKQTPNRLLTVSLFHILSSPLCWNYYHCHCTTLITTSMVHALIFQHRKGWRILYTA